MPDAILVSPAILLGGIIGLYEAIVIHRDVKVVSHRLMHTLHAILLSIGFVFLTLNAEFILANTPTLKQISFLNVFIVQISIGVLAAVKIHLVSRSDHFGSSFVSAETWLHSGLVGVLVVTAPYIYPLAESVLPRWLI
jgi:hypothetical protein